MKPNAKAYARQVLAAIDSGRGECAAPGSWHPPALSASGHYVASSDSAGGVLFTRDSPLPRAALSARTLATAALTLPLDDVSDEAQQLLRTLSSGSDELAEETLRDLTVRDLATLPSPIRPHFARRLAATLLRAALRALIEDDVLAFHTHMVHAAPAQPHDGALLECWCQIVSRLLAETSTSASMATPLIAGLSMALHRSAVSLNAYANLASVLEHNLDNGSEAENVLGLALEHLQSAQLPALEELVERARGTLSHLTHHKTLRGLAAYRRGDFKAALPSLQAAFDKGSQVQALLGCSRIRTGDVAAGKALLMPLIETGEASSEIAVLLAEALYEADERPVALRLASAVQRSGNPYRSRAMVVLAHLALDEGEVDRAHAFLFDAQDACEELAIRGFRRLTQAHAREGDSVRQSQADEEAAAMEALAPLRRTYAFLTNPLGQPAALVRDRGGVLFLGTHRIHGTSVGIRLRPLVEGEDPDAELPPQRSPFLLSVCARAYCLERMHTVFEGPIGRPLSSLLAGEHPPAPQLVHAILTSLAAAIVDIVARGEPLPPIATTRVFVSHSGSARLQPYDPYDVPDPAMATTEALAQRGAADAVRELGRLCTSLYADLWLPPQLGEVLEQTQVPEPSQRPEPRALLAAVVTYGV